MSLANLRKSKQSAKPCVVDVDKFIDDAVAYAAGHSGHCVGHETHAEAANDNAVKLVYFNGLSNAKRRMHNATFTFDDDTHMQLRVMSQVTGLSMSKLVRTLVQTVNEHNEFQHLVLSNARK